VIRSEAFSALMLAGGFLLILLLGEAIRRVLPSNPELARKSVHFLSGGMALSFPYLIKSHWTVLCLAMVFFAIVIITKKAKILRAVHDVGRRSHGALYFPIAVYVIFLLGHERPVLYFIPILVMTLSDTLAALLGGRYGSIKYEVEGTVKSLEGSAVFFLVTFLCVHLSLLLMTSIDKLSAVVIALVIATLVTGFEAISVGGSDNIVVPFGTYYILAKMTPQAPAVSVEDLWKLVVMIAVTIPISLKSRLLRASGLIGMALVNYAAWVLCDFYWFLPLLLGQVLLYLLAAHYVQRIRWDVTGHQIKVLVYSAIIPTILIFAANTVRGGDVFYLPYVASIVGQVAVIFYFFLSVSPEETSLLGKLRGHALLRVIVPVAASTLFIAGVPICLYLDKARLGSLGLIALGVWTATLVFQWLAVRYELLEGRTLRQKMRLLSVAVGTAVVFLTQALTVL
jgi:phytol kinase